MPALLFSGGIDSTTLAYDIVINPFRYGITGNRSATGGVNPCLLLVTDAGVRDTRKHDDLHDVVSDLRKVGGLPIEHVFVNAHEHLTTYAPSLIAMQGHSSLHPFASQYQPDIASMPFTPGLMSWLAIIASNLLVSNESEVGTSEFTSPLVYMGYQWDGPIWEKYDAGETVETDTTPEFVEALNILSRASGSIVGFRAPFLDTRMDRRMIVQLAQSLKVPLHKTSSCIQGWKKNCGICHQCMLRGAAFKGLGVSDV